VLIAINTTFCSNAAIVVVLFNMLKLASTTAEVNISLIYNSKSSTRSNLARV
jgi:hypothetical protein